MYYIGLDVHKKTISYCTKHVDGKVHGEGRIDATRLALDTWLPGLPQPWTGALEATIFTGWIYDYLKPHAHVLKVAHPAMLRAIAAAKKKNDQVDARMIADLLRCNLLPLCYMAPRRPFGSAARKVGNSLRTPAMTSSRLAPGAT